MIDKQLQWPEDAAALSQLHAGDMLYFSGVAYTARDAAHKRLTALLKAGEPLPIELHNAAIFYAGPTPCPPGKISGSIGPTTSGRMDIYKESLLKAGMKLMIGKGACMPELRTLCREYGAVYLAALGGVAALTAQTIRGQELVAWPELGAEALVRLRIERMPLVVINDIYGNDYYAEVTQK